jgi:hypothetical protein
VEGGKEGSEVVAIPHRKLCSNCEHGALSTSGVYCTLFREPILDETVALECAEFDPQPETLAYARPAPRPEVSNDRLTPAEVLASSDLETLVRAHLERSYSTLWGEVFDVKSADGINEAVAWMASEIRELVGGQS